MVHEITKEFCQNSYFENMTADFLLRCQKITSARNKLNLPLNIDNTDILLSLFKVSSVYINPLINATFGSGKKL